MAIKSTTFGRVELSGEDAVKFITYMNEEESNPKVEASLQRGRKALASVRAVTAAKSRKSDDAENESS
jgi:hypothetical protein